jgi:hypothetical protein
MLFVWLNNRQKMLISLKRNGDEVYQQSSANLKRQDLLMWDSVEWFRIEKAQRWGYYRVLIQPKSANHIRNPWSTTPSVPWMGLTMPRDSWQLRIGWSYYSQCRVRGPAQDASGNNFSLPNDALLGYAIPGNLEHMSLVNTGQTLLMLWKL